MDKSEIDIRFTYVAPKDGQPVIYESFRKSTKELAYLFYSLAPESRELSLAITALEEAVMWANAAVARRG